MCSSNIILDWIFFNSRSCNLMDVSTYSDERASDDSSQIRYLILLHEIIMELLLFVRNHVCGITHFTMFYTLYHVCEDTLPCLKTLYHV